MYPPPIQNLINEFSKFPGIGQKQATRLVFYLLKKDSKYAEKFSQIINELKKNIICCQKCFFYDEKDDSGICKICRAPKRDKTLICVLAKEQDLINIEKTREYSGVYFILGSEDPEDKNTSLKIDELIKRVKNENIKEIILGINPTSEGDFLALFIQRKLKPFGIKITRLGRGLPLGGEIEYADEETLSSALRSRT